MATDQEAQDAGFILPANNDWIRDGDDAITNNAKKTVDGLKDAKPFKRGLSSTTDNLDTIAERGRFHAFATDQLAALGLPGASTGFFDNIPSRNGYQAMQTFMQQASRPHMFGRGYFGSSYSPWESFGFASINQLRSSDSIDSLVTGKAYSPLTGAIGAGLGLPSSGTVAQDGILMVFGLEDGKSVTVGETRNVLLVWITLSATPGMFVRSKISGSWRDWSRIGGDSATQSSGLPGQVSVWGSSTPEGVVPELSGELREYGVQVHQKSSGGEWSGQTAARIGASSITLTPAGGSIPASGAVTVTSGGFIDGDPVNLLQPLTGWLGGVHGALTGIGNLATGRYEFTRTTPGAAISMASGAWVPEVKIPAHLNILGAGKNDLNVGRTAAHLTKVIARRDQAIAYWQSRNQDFLILGHFVNIGTPASDEGRTQIEADNADAKAKYPNNFIDMQGLLSGTELWEWTGITPTSEDLSQQSLGNMPPSIQGSGNHLNEAGDNYLSYKIIQWMIAKKYIGDGRVPFSVLTQQRVENSVGRTVKVWDHLNNREQLIYGDTGLRDIGASIPRAQWARARRIGNTVEIYINNCDLTGLASNESLLDLPTGFRPAFTQRLDGYWSGSGYPYADSSSIKINGTNTGTQIISGKFSTTDPWPTSLPGSAIGTIPF